MRFLRRFGVIRYCILQYHLRERSRAYEAAERHRQAIMALLGTMTIQWASIELILNTFIDWHRQTMGALARSHPRAFTGKMKYLRFAANDVRLSHEDRETIKALKDRLSALNAQRVNIIHGLVHQRNSRTTIWHVHIAKEYDSGLIRRNVIYTSDDITQLSQQMGEVASEISPFFARIVGLPHPANR